MNTIWSCKKDIKNYQNIKELVCNFDMYYNILCYELLVLCCLNLYTGPIIL